MYVETGVSARPVHFRKMFDSMQEAINDINKYKEYSNVYHTIYKFRETEQKYDIYGNKTRIGPDYSTAFIDKVVLDIDAYQTFKIGDIEDSYYTDKAIEDMRILEKWADKKNLLRQYRMSGGGFYFIFAAKGHPLKLRDFELNLMNNLEVNIDVSTVGDTSRMMRVTNSFNFKENRKRFCIPLKQEELINLSFSELRELAKKPRLHKRYLYGENIEDFSHCKLDIDKIKRKKLKLSLNSLEGVEEADNILKKYGWKTDQFCDSIKGILNLNHVGNSLRIELIKYFKTIVKVKYEDCVRLMVSLLGNEGMHSAVEGQAKYAYAGDYSFTPHKLKALGYCDLKCNDCIEYKKLFFNIKEKIKNGFK